MKTLPIFIALCACCWLAGIQCTRAEDIIDPMSYFWSHYQHEEGDKMLVLRLDADHDGNDDFLITLSSKIDKQGNGGWTLFLKRGETYVEAGEKKEDGTLDPDSGCSLNKDAYQIGNIPELGKWGILTVDVTRGKRGGIRLLALWVEGNSFRQAYLGERVDSTDPKDYHSFPNPLSPAILEADR